MLSQHLAMAWLNNRQQKLGTTHTHDICSQYAIKRNFHTINHGISMHTFHTISHVDLTIHWSAGVCIPKLTGHGCVCPGSWRGLYVLEGVSRGGGCVYHNMHLVCQ